MKTIEEINQNNVKKILSEKKIPDFFPGDVIKVGVRITEGKKVPNVLISGDHAKIKDWRLSQSEAITRDRRPDLWQKYKKN